MSLLPGSQFRCDRCGDRFATGSEYEVHARIQWTWDDDTETGDMITGECMTHDERRALRLGGGDPYPMTEIEPGLWAFPPNPPEDQEGLDELVRMAQFAHGEFN